VPFAYQVELLLFIACFNRLYRFLASIASGDSSSSRVAKCKAGCELAPGW